MKQDYGFKFWLLWIFNFAVSFILAALFWSGILFLLLGPIHRNEFVWTWAVAVFGSWFLIVTPFMRKKEQIWKRLNLDQEKAVDAWMKGMGGFLLAMIFNLIFWSWFYQNPILQSSQNLYPPWLKSVGLTFLILLFPFLAYMYRKADAIFNSAVTRQNEIGVRFRTAFVAKVNRILPEKIAVKIEFLPPLLENGNLVQLKLKDGRLISHAFILHQKELLGIYDYPAMDFEMTDIVEVIPHENDEILPYEESKWLRLDMS